MSFFEYLTYEIALFLVDNAAVIIRVEFFALLPVFLLALADEFNAATARVQRRRREQ